jgi:peptidoglycan/LPS O-acetylase OafA/YrhL
MFPERNSKLDASLLETAHPLQSLPKGSGASSIVLPPLAMEPLPAIRQVDTQAPERAPQARQPSEKHIPALDGIRGIAILLVILHHSLHGWGPAQSAFERICRSVLGHCWVGVDLFFVLSGFLITGILIDTQRKRRYFASFYPRRMLRTFPLYYATILVCFVLLPALPISGVEWLRDLSPRQGWFWLHVSNFYNLSHNILRMDGPSIGWMSTFWSLAVEEHFYLVWPLVVCWCSPRQVFRISLGLLGGVLLLRMAFAVQGYEFQYIYNNTFTRLDGMLFGSMVAALSRSEGGLRRHVPAFRILLGTCAVGLVLLLFLGSRVAGLYPYCAQTIVFTGIAAVFAGLLVLVLEAPPESRTRAFLSGRFLQACGKYSYAMYILNIPLFLLIDVVFRPETHPILGSKIPGILAYSALGILLSLAAAVVTWNLLEKHCLKLKRFFVAA